MTEQEILDLAATANSHVKLFLDEEDGLASFYGEFNAGEDREPGDVSWDNICDVNADLNRVGLEVYDTDADEDSYWGNIRKLPDNPLTTPTPSSTRGKNE